MAVDGSFCLEFELERFLSRCPKLANISQFNYLLKKEHTLAEEEVVNAVAELFLHPNYTVPLVGGFRPIAQKIVDRVVDLLRLVPNLRSISDDSMMEFDEDNFFGKTENLDNAEVVCVINFYVTRGRGLNLHELACLAFCRALDLIPSLLGSVLSYFKYAPPPFERIMLRESISEPLAMAGGHLLNVVRASYRLLLAEPEVFTTLWDWSCFLDLVQQLADLDKGDNAEFLKNVSDIRWCGIQILSLILKISDRATSNFGLGAEEAFACLLRWYAFCQDVSLEKAGWYLETFDMKKSESVSENMNHNPGHFGLSSLTVSYLKSHENGQSNWSSKQATWVMASTGNPFVLTSAMQKSFEMVLLAVSQRWPVLMYGPAGAGKTALISKLARDYGSRVLSIHMDEQIDGKTLIGSYVCTEQPGEFRWQPGSLTQAVLNGFWVVFEDIDKAPADVQSILLPLLEGASSFLTGHGEAVRVAEGFRLFSTVSSSKLDISRATEGRNSLGALWRRIMIGSSSNKDLLSIVKVWYPDLEPLAEKLIETFVRVNQIAGFHLGTSASFDSLGRFSLRDLLKWCKRIAGLGFCFGGDGLSAYVCSSIYQEAVDIFAAFSSSAENRLTIMKEIAKMWAVPISAVETLYPANKPVIQELRSDLRIGRITLQRIKMAFRHENKPFVEIRSSLHVLERIACSVKCNEPVLLVGETGTGKTTLVQNMATRLGQKLTVLNLSQQSDVADLLGGFKPMNAQFVCFPLYMEFENLFCNTFSSKGNEEFLVRLKKFLSDKNWKMLLSGFQKGVQKIVEIGKSGSGTKRKRPLSEELLKAWESFSLKLEASCAQISASAGMIFSFVEGAFVTALKNGEWILLDEVNLAPPETLQSVIGVLEEENGSLCLAERGDIDYIHRHPNFRIFACMNPATDAGKRDLPFSIRSRFTEYFIDDVLNDEDLTLFINQFMDDSHSNLELISKIVHFYKAAKRESEERLQDGANQKPQYSLRSLYRALEYTKKARRKFGFQKALYDGFCMFFLTLLDESSAKIMNQLILSYLLGGSVPPQVPFDGYLMLGEKAGPDDFLGGYVLTKSVKEHLRNLARAIFVGRYPVLLQGPTSSGKTSLVQFLASITGHEFVRINNHEHTDLQEYLGSYITDASGKLVFYEGVLVKAVRNGYWIVLDELNLAPSDVLEALNRLLDDNRELFVPELRETIRAHPGFMLFATQNPPTFYGGRKMLSRAFRNRFVEIHVDEIPQDELSTILEKRCKIPESYAKKMVEIMKELQLHRQSSKVFAGKHGFITPRDLFRWADRFRTFGKSYEDLALDGYYLLAERLRDDGEKRVVQEVLERHLRIKLAKDDMYKKDPAGGDRVLNLCKYSGVSDNLGKIIWTRSMWRLYFLVERCYKLREPVLLVGETGGGKTTVCQLLSICLESKLHILNCHQYTETSDFLGGFYPIRERSKISSEFKYLCEQMMLLKAFIHFPGDVKISSDINQASLTLNHLAVIINSYRQGLIFHPDVTLQELDSIEQMNLDLVQLYQKWQTIFMWQDGPLVQAMNNGDLFLVDEISLADDSVLERLNSVLEPERKLSLAEKGGSDLEQITAHPNFFLLATMNPGGDYGKKELSPALRNRFTEIWVPSVSDLNELKSIARERISNSELSFIVDLMLNFWEWFNQLQTGRLLTVRDLLSWVAFIKVTERSLQPEFAFLHGSFLVLLDGLSLGTGISKSEAADLREKCLSFLLEGLKQACNHSLDYSTLSMLENYGWADIGRSADTSCTGRIQSDSLFGIHPFYIEKGDDHFEDEGFEFLAPTTRRNALRVLRAMQLAKPVLLEGSPGVGKTSLIVALGKYSGHSVVRINLSEQTDIMDLLGSDLPVESDEGMQFAWSDGILLQALKNGSWVLLDELNLAPQSVLEGLNAILDHRAEVFIPELGLTFKCPPSFRVFACQNPSYQGGGRKGLPKSFLNRFTKVYVDELVEDDHLFICHSIYPSIPRPILSKLILFNKRLHEDTMLYHKFGQDGSPWEFNLRDVIRSCQIIQGAPERSKYDCFLNSVYVQRMRTSDDRREVVQIYEQVFGLKPFINPYPSVQLNPQYLIVGNTCINRNHSQSFKISDSELKILPGIRNSLEAVAHCVQHQWLCILVGPSSSGKTSLIRVLAELTGNVLNELNLSSATDISELLGCFEQYNAFRNYRLTIARVECFVNEYCSLQLKSSSEAYIRRKDLITRWLAFLSSIDYCFSTSSAPTYVENWRMSSFNSVSLLVEIIELLRLDLEKDILPVSWSCKDLDRTLNTIRKLQDDIKRRMYSAKFEWVTGLLIKAIENGEWIVLENANLCNPTVLDRINSLVEQSGSITVNERGAVDGKPVVLHPHSQFRMFLTVNPSYGEVSRAMRNRGVEIYMMQPYWLLGEEFSENRDETELKDVKRFLVLSGIPVSKLVDSMAKAHIYARDGGLHLDISITYLELARWVQLFQRLLINGNRPVWSLQISWEHTYLSSLGEVEGKHIVNHAKASYLSMPELLKFDFSRGCSLCLPGGWPTPLKLQDFIWYSKETSVKQNCIYLEFLVAQSSSYAFGIALGRSPVGQAPTARGSVGTYLVDMKMLHEMMFPKASNEMIADYGGLTEFDLPLTKKMLLIAANWIIEQATENDLQLYLLWFSWFGSQLQPFSQFFNSFLALLKQELEHPIWNCIVSCRRELMSHHIVDVESKPLPLLSLEFVDLSASADLTKSCSKLLTNAIDCVGILRLSYRQWNAESEYAFSDKTWCFVPVLRSIRRLEEEVLDLLVESPSFDVLFRSYNDLLENHILFWNGITSSQFECLLISWRSLIKDAAKLQEFCPKEVENFQEERKNLDRVSSWSFRSQKSLLWVHGGHPFLPSSADLYQKQHQLLNLCELVWPRMTKSWEPAATDSPIEAAVSSIRELRFLTMQGVCMSSYIMSKTDEDDLDIVQQLEEMYQMLLRKFEHEKHNLERNMGITEPASSVSDLSTCCVFSPIILCRRSAFDSWLDTLPIIDHTSFLLDMELLQNLSKIVMTGEDELQSALSSLSDRLESSLNFSLNFSSRPPTDFLPHQKILWTLDAWTSVDSVNAKISSFVLEMWFRWHTTLWKHCSVLVEVQNLLGLHGCDVRLPDMLFQPVKLTTLDKILRSTFAVRDYSVHSLKLRAASHNLWQSSPNVPNILGFLFSTARSLFKQIIFSHKKSFEADKYAAINSIICSIQEKIITQDNLIVLISLLASSSHYGLTSVMHSLIEPLLGELYLQCPSTDPVYNLGCAWLRIGGLRYHLLICCDDLDPAVKYSFKYSQLMEKISSLELEIEVRRESVHLAGCFSSREADKRRTVLLENLKAERKRLHKQIVFRSDPGKFTKLKYECDEFFKLVTTSIGLTKNVESMNVQEIIGQVHNWQETASCFIERLSNEYSAYIDIVQPVQVAVYEMKLGLSLVFSSSLRKRFLDRVRQDDMDTVLGKIYSFVKFPRGCASENVSFMVDTKQAKLSSRVIKFPTNIAEGDMNLLENLVRGDVSTDKAVSVLQLKAAIRQNILLRVAHSAAEAHFMDISSFMLLDKIFDEFARLWINKKVQIKTKEDHEAQQYKFRPRAFKIENIIEVDISTLGSLIASESFSEWQELLSEEELTERKKADEGHETLGEDWNFLQESILNNIVHIHNALFGSVDLVQSPGSIQVSDADRLASFVDSYTLGIRMIKDLEGSLSASLDAKLMPEHLLCLSLEYEKNFILSHKADHAYNFYKDSNASVMAKMVEPVATLQLRIHALLNEWDDHPALQRILDVIEMILAIPLSTPLAQALSGLQFLLNRVQMLQETVSKFPLSDQLEPIFVLVSSWQKLEFESWPALLDEVQAQFEINAGKLWFPLYSVLQHRHSADIKEYNQSTIQSLEEFIQTSSIGEFRKRLQLLFAFHGQITTGICWGSYASPCQMENVKILYNIFGFYTQFLPLILEHIKANRRAVETELKEFLKLCRWERSDSYLTMENSKRTRQKLRKLIQKYTDLLQQPVMLIFKQEAAQKGIINQAIEGSNLLSDNFKRNKDILNVVCDRSQFIDKDRSAWLATWRRKVEFALQNLQLGKTTEFDFPNISFKVAKEVASIIRECVASKFLCHAYQEERKQVWYTIEKICRTAIDCGELWNDRNKSLGKRRALSDLLKLLDSCGLSKHRSTFVEDEFKTYQASWWLLQPSYNVQHLLLAEGISSGDVDVAALDQFPSLPLESLETEWRTANQYFFKSMASVNQLRQICLNFHKDFTLEQVTRSGSYLDHLVAIQQEQRAAAYGFAEQLKCLKRCILPLEHLFSSSVPFASVANSEGSFSQNQHVTFKCMWQQKQLFDSLCAMLHDECLLLRTVEHNHLNTCQIVKAAAKQILLFIEKFVPDFQKSKDLLDNYLLGHNRVMTTEAVSLHPNGVTEQMEQLVYQNFLLVREFEVHLRAFRKQNVDGGSVKEVLFGQFEAIFEKGNLIAEEYNSSLQARNQLENMDEDSIHSGGKISGLQAGFGEAITGSYQHIVDAFRRVDSSNNGGCAISEESLGNISMWKVLFESDIANLQLGAICEELVKAIHFAGEIVVHDGSGNPSLVTHLKHLYSLLDPLLTFSNGLLLDFLVMHRTVSIMTDVLAKIFASLYSQGFGISKEDEGDETGPDRTQDANGTGMGEGAGLNDVSDQINDEDQLLGTSEKPSEEQDAFNDVPSKNEKGIEMEQDFAADAFSVSEESGDDNDDDGEDEQLESALGETGADSEIVDEKLWDKDDDNENPSNTKEKYESGPSVKEKDPSGRELRAKDDSATTTDEAGELDPEEFDKQNDDNGDEEGPDVTENMEDMNIDKEEAFSDPTGLKLDEPKPGSEEDIDMDEPEGADPMEDTGPEELDESAECKNGEEEKPNSIDETLNEVESEKPAENSGREDPENKHEKNTEMDLEAPKNDVFELGTSDLVSDHASNAESATQPKGDSNSVGLQNDAPEAKGSNSNDIQNDIASMRGLPNASENEIAVADSSKGGKLSDDLPQNQLPQLDSSSLQKIEPNPCRNVGDALDGWKERVKVSIDLQENNVEVPDDLVDENADEFGFTSEIEKGTAQALGPAASDQIDQNINANEPDGNDRTADRNDHADMEIEEQQHETRPIHSSALNLRNKIEEQVEISDMEQQPEGSPDFHSHRDGYSETFSDSLVSMKRSYMSEDIHQFGKLSVNDEEMGKAHNLEEVSSDMKDNAATLWRRYELLTTRLSQELAEQLRLVMEPTLASKLQGDYKTGKRINMKKVIPYIASHYRKDKIWLRRTRPNKRDYQVVIAVDDSRSMSESRCGDVAIEALVTVCRAMSQLEVGNLAVASYGKKGNIRLLHDFDHPFTGEAGVKMLSSLTFKQENTIADEPMVDLLKYMNNMLDAAVAKARLPSGHNPLQQLVLIIADGRFHEKENLKRRVRDILSKKRMVAFLLLDSPEESIMDLMEASFQGGNVKFSKYLDSFPFPFYVVLKNIEALPRTLADLLRQWFELMQYSRD